MSIVFLGRRRRRHYIYATVAEFAYLNLEVGQRVTILHRIRPLFSDLEARTRVFACSRPCASAILRLLSHSSSNAAVLSAASGLMVTLIRSNLVPRRMLSMLHLTAPPLRRRSPNPPLQLLLPVSLRAMATQSHSQQPPDGDEGSSNTLPELPITRAGRWHPTTYLAPHCFEYEGPFKSV